MHKKTSAGRMLLLISAILALVFLLFVSLNGCTDAPDSTPEPDGLKGVWAAPGMNDHEFDGKGGGSMGHGSHNHSFTYTVDGDTLTITVDGHGGETKYVYTFALSGNTLTLTDTAGKSTAFTKK